MKNRIYSIRKELKLSQEVFGNHLGVTGASISRIEKGERSITEQMILAICREFKVNEHWLRNNEGEMFLDFNEDEYTRAAASLSDDAMIRYILIEYWKLDTDSKKMFKNFIITLAEKMKEQP